MDPSSGAESAPAFSLRPGTADDVIYEQVVRQNEYRVPDRLAPDSVVVDIGAHVGSFSYLALTRGAASVVAYEPEASNHQRAEANLASFGSRARVRRAAVWRSDTPAARLPFWASGDQANTGGGSVIWDTNDLFVDAIAFDTVIDEASEHGRRQVSLVKIDCEGAEFPILLTSKMLHRIDRIVGEYHELRAGPPAHCVVAGYTQFTLDDLVAALEAAGFAVDAQGRATGTFGEMGLFFADRQK